MDKVVHDTSHKLPIYDSVSLTISVCCNLHNEDLITLAGEEHGLHVTCVKWMIHIQK